MKKLVTEGGQTPLAVRTYLSSLDRNVLSYESRDKIRDVLSATLRFAVRRICCVPTLPRAFPLHEIAAVRQSQSTIAPQSSSTE